MLLGEHIKCLFILDLDLGAQHTVLNVYQPSSVRINITHFNDLYTYILGIEVAAATSPDE